MDARGGKEKTKWTTTVIISSSLKVRGALTMVFNDTSCSASFKTVSTVTGTGSDMLNVSYVCSAITFTTLLPKCLKVGNVLVSFR